MDHLVTLHAGFLLLTISTTVILLLGLGIFVVTRNPRLPVSWVFAALCSTTAIAYLSSLFMGSVQGDTTHVAPFFLRLKWIAITLGPAIFVHLMSFYFPPGWQRHRRSILAAVYLPSLLMAGLILWTDLVVAGLLHRDAPHIVNPLPGPLLWISAAIFMAQLLVGIGGLVSNYRTTRSRSLRRQIALLLVPAGLVFAGSLVYWGDVLTSGLVLFAHELPDLLLLLAVAFLARIVVRYGSFAGRPASLRTLFYSALAVTITLLLLYLAFILDRQLMPYTSLPYPPVTGVVVVVLVIGYPAFRRWLAPQIDQRLFKVEGQQQAQAMQLVEALAEAPDPAQLQTRLLDTLCELLDVRHGYVALTGPDLPPDTLLVQTVYGDPVVQAGDQISCPRLSTLRLEPQLVATLPDINFEEPCWQEIALTFPLIANDGEEAVGGLLGLGDKRNGRPFSGRDMALCTQLAKQLSNVGWLSHLSRQRNYHLELARQQSQALHQLGEQVIDSTRQALSSWQRKTAPIEIGILGPMQVYRNGELVPEADWGSEKAKAMLAYLLWKNPAGVTREELCEALWPDRPFSETANVFHVTLHRLRRVFQPDTPHGKADSYILHDRGRYRFNTGLSHYLDVTNFESLAGSSELDALRVAVELYRGPYLEDADWALPPDVEFDRRRLEHRCLETLQRLAAVVDAREAIVYLEKILAVEPVNETAVRAITLSYLTMGRRDLARRQLARWQQAMVELDLDPEPELGQLQALVEPAGKPIRKR